MIALSLPMPPSANNLHTVARGRKILSDEGRQYYSLVAWEVRRQIGKRPPLTDLLFVEYHVFLANGRRRDLSNMLKALEDALTHAGVWEDDSLIDDFRMRRAGRSETARVDVVIKTMEEAGAA